MTEPGRMFRKTGTKPYSWPYPTQKWGLDPNRPTYCSMKGGYDLGVMIYWSYDLGGCDLDVSIRNVLMHLAHYRFHDDALYKSTFYLLKKTRNTFCRTRSLSNANLFIFDHVTFIQFKICCCVQNLMKIGWSLTEIWRYIDFQNGGRPPSWNVFTTIVDQPRSLLLAAAACQISCQCNTQIGRYSYLNFSHIWLEMPIQAPKMGVWGTLDP